MSWHQVQLTIYAKFSVGVWFGRRDLKTGTTMVLVWGDNDEDDNKFDDGLIERAGE